MKLVKQNVDVVYGDMDSMGDRLHYAIKEQLGASFFDLSVSMWMVKRQMIDLPYNFRVW